MSAEDESTRADDSPPAVPPVVRVRMAGAGHRRTWFVHIACFIAIALFGTACAMIYFGWLEAKEPAGVISVEGNATVASATVTVSGPALPTPLTRAFADGTAYRLRFHVPPGVFRVEIFRGTEVLYSADRLTIDRQMIELKPFGKQVPATKAASSQYSGK